MKTQHLLRKSLKNHLPFQPRSLSVLLAALALGACSAAPPTSAVNVKQQADDPVIAAVGDIAQCKYEAGKRAKDTAALLNLGKYSRFPILTLGDLAYEYGDKDEFDKCYDVVWKGLKGRTRPAPGNHDYGNKVKRHDIEPYFSYFGIKESYYSFDAGSWHIVSLDSMADQVPKAPRMSAQVAWLKNDLEMAIKDGKTCILAYWHHPLFTSGHHGRQPDDPGKKVGPLWEVLEAYRADLILNGHEHNYERFALQTMKGVADPQHGIREIVIGTGGSKIYPLKEPFVKNSEKRLSGTNDHGVLFLALHRNGYSWDFRNTKDQSLDQSQQPQACHPKPGG